jgi:hypothetical protein
VGRDQPRREYFSDQVRKAQRDRQTVAVFRSVEVQLGERHDVFHHLLDVSRPLPDFHGQWIRDFATGIGPQARDVAPRPQIPQMMNAPRR